jgi:hypothetical protein
MLRKQTGILVPASLVGGMSLAAGFIEVLPAESRED